MLSSHLPPALLPPSRSLLQSELGPSLTFADLIEAPTPRLMAQRISALLREEMFREFGDESSVPVVRVSYQEIRGELPAKRMSAELGDVPGDGRKAQSPPGQGC